MKFIASLMLFLALAVEAMAGSIEGRVADTQKQPLQFVNVILYQQDGKTLVKGTITDDSGAYSLQNVKDGSYVLSFQYMGFKTVTRNVTLNAQNQHKAVVRVTLSEDSEQLEEVAVVAQKQTMKLDIDRKVFNVDQDIASAGGSASEVLENIPSVEVDAEGNVSLRGSESVTIWINGKAQGMSSDNRGDILQQMPAESIERIEVITNPSSKFSPEGSAGIINIVLKRDRKAGYYGGVQLNANTFGGGRLGANINFSSGILDAYANVGYGLRKGKNGGFTNRDNLLDDGTAVSFLNSTNKGKNNGKNLFARAGLTWHVTTHDDISLAYMGMFGSNDRKQTYFYNSADYSPYSSELSTTMDRVRKNTSDGDSHMNNFEVSYRHEWATTHDIELTVSRHGWASNGGTIFDQVSDYRRSDGSSYQELSYQNQTLDNESTGWEVQLDYQQPVGASSKIEGGYKGNFNHQNSPTETFSDEDRSQTIELLFNRFIYDSNVHAVYLNWQSRIAEKFGYQLGLRGEGWNIDTESYDYNAEYNNGKPEAFKKDYFKVFPTMFLSYQVSETQELQLNYTRRLRRPWGGQLNSFKNISDSTNISYGNPQLTPEYSNSFEFNYIKNWDNHTLSLSAYYRPSSDIIQRIGYISNSIRYSTSENVSKSVSSGVEIIGKNRLWNRLDLTTTVNIFYYKLNGGNFTFHLDDGSDYRVDIANSKDFSWNARLLASLMLPKEISFQTTFNYVAPRVITQGKREASYSLDMGLRKTFFNRKFTVALNGRDLLDSRKFRSTTSGRGFSQESESWRGGRRGVLQLSWSFGNMNNDKKREGRDGQDSGDDDAPAIGGGFEN